jgi:hypothetical protein
MWSSTAALSIKYITIIGEQFEVIQEMDDWNIFAEPAYVAALLLHYMRQNGFDWCPQGRSRPARSTVVVVMHRTKLQQTLDRPANQKPHWVSYKFESISNLQ